MIKQIIEYDNNVLLTLYHDSYELSKDYVPFEASKFIESKKLLLCESIVDNHEEIICDTINSGILYCNHSKNPYSTYSTLFTEYINYDHSIYHNGSLNIDYEEFQSIHEFVEEFTGYSINNNPFSFGNILVFKPRLIESTYFEITEDILGIELKGLSQNSLTVIKLKNNDLVFKSHVVHGENCKIEPESTWGSCDIEVFEDGILVYGNYDIRLMRSFQFNLSVSEKKVDTQLKTRNKRISIESSSKYPTTHGVIESKELNSYLNRERTFINHLKNYRSDDFFFLGKDETSRAFDLFEKIASKECEELWIFDPYFTNYGITGGLDKLRDIIKIIAKNRNSKKIIVLEDKDSNEFDLSDFKSKVIDQELTSLISKFEGLNIEILSSSVHFHDRFIFLKDTDILYGYIIGTSLNSFGENYSTLLRINSENAKEVFDKLVTEVVQSKIVNKEVL